jgi:drug/metabolite transporter (DMT)-like permease
MILASALLHALWNYAARKASGDLAVLLPGLWIAVAIATPVVLTTRGLPLLLAAYPYVLITGVVHAAYFIALARCYERGDISVVYPVARGTGVAGAATAGIVLLGEQTAPSGVVGIAAVCGGVLLIGLSRTGGRRWAHGLPTSMLVGAIICIYTVVDKIGVTTTDPLLYIFNMYVISAVIVGFYRLVRRERGAARLLAKNWPRSLVVGVGSMGAYLVVLFAFRIAPVAYAAAVREVSVVFGALLGFLLLGEPARIKKILGILSILCGLVLIRLA